VHLLFTFAGLTLLGNAAMLSAWKQILLLATTLAGMLLTAKVFSKSEGKTERKGEDVSEGKLQQSAGGTAVALASVATTAPSAGAMTAIEPAGAHASAAPGDTETRLLYCNLK
jgi:hypothetical protein